MRTCLLNKLIQVTFHATVKCGRTRCFVQTPVPKFWSRRRGQILQTMFRLLPAPVTAAALGGEVMAAAEVAEVVAVEEENVVGMAEDEWTSTEGSVPRRCV